MDRELYITTQTFDNGIRVSTPEHPGLYINNEYNQKKLIDLFFSGIIDIKKKHHKNQLMVKIYNRQV